MEKSFPARIMLGSRCVLIMRFAEFQIPRDRVGVGGGVGSFMSDYQSDAVNLFACVSVCSCPFL